MSTTFNKGDRVKHKHAAIEGEATIVFLPAETGYYDSEAYGLRYDHWDYSKNYRKSPDGKDFHVSQAENLELVKAYEPKAGTTTLISTTLSYENLERIVRVTSGSAALSLSVTPNPHRVGDIDGFTSLTPEQAEQLAHDLLARVAEIRGGQN